MTDRAHPRNKRARGRAAWVALVLSLASVLVLEGTASAEEPFRAFLDGLRRRGLFAEALEYLESMRTSALVSSEQKETILYEEARTLIEGAAAERDVAKRLDQLEAARAKLEQFVSTHAGHSLVSQANSQLGNVLIERGRAGLEKAQRSAQTAEKDALRAEARSLFDQAKEVFARAEAQFEADLNRFAKFLDEKQREQIEARRLARLEVIQAKLRSAQVLYEMARSYEPKSKEALELLEQAAKKFDETYSNYRRVLAGLYARMWQGRCYQEMGQTRQALSYYGELLAQPDEPDELRTLKAKTLRLTMQCWTSDAERKYDEAIQRGTEWLKQAGGGNLRTPEGLAIRWLTARALSARATEPSAPSAQRERDQSEAMQLAAEVAQHEGEYQQEAKQLVARARPEKTPAEPTTFADARDLGQAKLDTMQVAIARLEAARQAGEKGEIAALEAQRDEARNEASRLFRLALGLRQPETPLDEVNQLRYYLCYLMFQSGRYYDAAVMGEFLARRYPDAAGARPAARIAMLSYVQTYNAQADDERQFDTERLRAMATYLAEKWPQQAESDEAWLNLGTMAIRSQQFEEGAAYLEKVAARSPLRAEADLKAAQAYWVAYLRAIRSPAEQRPAAEKLNEMVHKASELFDRGIAATRGAGATASPPEALLAAELSRAQIFVHQSQYAEAIAVLERPENGALALVKEGHPITRHGELASETYKVALRAYVGAQRMPEAEASISALDELSASDATGGAELTKIYVALGRELEEQVARLRAANQKEELAAMLEGFELFLDKIAARGKDATFASLQWVAETYLGLGDGLGMAGSESARAKAYYEKAAKTFGTILSRGKTKPEFLPSADLSTRMRIRLAHCDRQLGNYEEAIEQLVAILREKPATLEAQIDAAATYQDWGARDARYFASAIGGARRAKTKDGQLVNIVWGWAKLSAMTLQNPKLRNIYHDARYRLAECCLGQAATLSGDEKSQRLREAEQVITATARLDPSMGDDLQRSRTDRLLKKIQQALEKPATGLDGVLRDLAGTTNARAASNTNRRAPSNTIQRAPHNTTRRADGVSRPLE